MRQKVKFSELKRTLEFYEGYFIVEHSEGYVQTFEKKTVKEYLDTFNDVENCLVEVLELKAPSFNPIKLDSFIYDGKIPYTKKVVHIILLNENEPHVPNSTIGEPPQRFFSPEFSPNYEVAIVEGSSIEIVATISRPLVTVLRYIEGKSKRKSVANSKKDYESSLIVDYMLNGRNPNQLKLLRLFRENWEDNYNKCVIVADFVLKNADKKEYGFSFREESSEPIKIDTLTKFVVKKEFHEKKA